MRKLKFLFKVSVFGSIATALFVVFFLQEIAFLGNGFEKACKEKGVNLPLTDPRIVVEVGQKTLSIFDGETLLRRYDIATGSSRRLGVLDKDVDSTPLGEYKVVRKAVRESMLFRGSRFLQINYPNFEDADNGWDLGRLDRGEYDAIYAANENNQPPPAKSGIGGNIGIQGNYFSIVGSTFTDGSIGLSNGDLVDIYDYIPVGTPVIIKP